MNRPFLLFALLATTVVAAAQTTREAAFADTRCLAGNYYPYTEGPFSVTPPPEGYKPFYISHFGRHGSRYMADNKPFHNVIEAMEKGKKDNNLTPLGDEVLACVKRAYSYAKGKGGLLSLLGKHEHEHIANRMFQNYSEAFADSNAVDARSTTVNRAKQSMQAACTELKRLNPKLKISERTKHEDSYFMSPSNDSVKWTAKEKALDKRIDSYMDSLRHVPQAQSRLFKSLHDYKKYFKSRATFNNDLYNILQDTLCLPEFHANLPEVFSNEELFAFWKHKNMRWVGLYGLYPGTHPHYLKMRGTLRNFISWADLWIASGKSGANLRYGHDTQIYPLSHLMGFSGCPSVPKGVAFDDVYKYSANFQIIPMGANIQVIFFRKAGSDDILVKFLLQEKEQRLPVSTDCWPFYHWKDVKNFWLKQIKH